MTTTREAALEAALIKIMAHPHGSNEIACLCSDALSTPATEPQGYVEITEEMIVAGRKAADDQYYKWCGFGPREDGQGLDGMHFIVREALKAALSTQATKYAVPADWPKKMLPLDEHVTPGAGPLAARPAPQPAAEHEYPDPLIAEDRYEDDQPAADTRVVVKEQLAQWFYALVHMDTRGKLDAEISASLQSQMLEIIGTATPAPTYQSRVKPWLDACFGPEIAGDKTERNHRFLEEALELVQSGGCTASEAHQLVDYVYGRPVGEMGQEVGGVMNTLAALCLAYGRDMHEDGETELARVWTKVEKIRAKQAAKPKHSPLPEHAPAPSDKTAEAAIDRCMQEIEDIICEADVSYPAGRDAGTSIDFDRDAVLAALRALAGKGE